MANDHTITTPVKQYAKLYFGNEIVLIELIGNNATALFSSTSLETDILVEHKTYIMHQSKLYKELGDEWGYDDCWDYIRDNGFDIFINKFEVQ